MDVPASTATPAPVTGRTASRLRLANACLVVLHAAQVVVLLLLTTDFAIPVTETFPEGPPGSAAPAPEPLLDVRLGLLVAAFLALAALDHLVVAGGRAVGSSSYLDVDPAVGGLEVGWTWYAPSD